MIESGSEIANEKQYFSLNELLTSIEHIISNELKNKELKYFYTKLNINIYSDKSKLRQVLLHLLSNAIKFTEKGHIELDVKLDKNKLIFIITDTGIGISKYRMDKIFKTFYQIDNSIRRKFDGVGLGLPICKYLIEKMGGEIWCESIENEGSKFYFNIEHLEEKNDFKLNYKINKSDFEHLKNYEILLVEDESVSVDIVKRLAKKFDFNVTHSKNGKEAIDTLKISDNKNCPNSYGSTNAYYGWI